MSLDFQTEIYTENLISLFTPIKTSKKNKRQFIRQEIKDIIRPVIFTITKASTIILTNRIE